MKVEDPETKAPEAHLAVVVTRVIRIVAFTALALVVMHGVGLVSRYAFGESYLLGFVPFFDLDHERNAPSWFSSVLALAGAVLFFLIWRLVPTQGKTRRRWFVLCLAFVFVSVDEFTSIHEELIVPVRDWLHLSGILYFSWVVPYGLLVIALGSYLLPLLAKLDPQIRRHFLASAFVYLSGAIGMELVGGAVFEALGEQRNLRYDLITSVEEILEIAGLILLLRAQLLLFSKFAPSIDVAVRLK